MGALTKLEWVFMMIMILMSAYVSNRTVHGVEIPARHPDI